MLVNRSPSNNKAQFYIKNTQQEIIFKDKQEFVCHSDHYRMFNTATFWFFHFKPGTMQHMSKLYVLQTL